MQERIFININIKITDESMLIMLSLKFDKITNANLKQTK